MKKAYELSEQDLNDLDKVIQDPLMISTIKYPCDQVKIAALKENFFVLDLIENHTAEMIDYCHREYTKYCYN